MSAIHLPPGTRIADYVIQAVLGRGGFGITYIAYDHGGQCYYAVKEVFPREIAMRLPDGRVEALDESLEEIWLWTKDKFLNEAGVLASFDHPSIVKVHRLLETNNTLYMVMEYIHGNTLEKVLNARNPFTDTAGILDFLHRIHEGLARVHAANILHLDIKPQNILVQADGTPVLIDFGASRWFFGDKSGSLDRIYSPCYSAMELYGSRGRIGPWTDIYSLGAVLHRVITGEPPPNSTDRAQDGDSYKPLQSQSRLRHFDPRLLRAVDWALQLNRDRRPRSITDWESALPGPQASTPPAPMDGRTPPREWQGSTASDSNIQTSGAPTGLIIALLGIVLLGIVLAVGVFLLHRENEKHQLISYAPAIPPPSTPVPTPAFTPAPPPTPTPAPISTPTPIPTPYAPPSLQTPTPEPPLGIEDFWDAYSQSVLSTQTSTPEWDASFYADPCDFYQYAGGPAPRATIALDRAKLYQDYPTRHVSDLEILDAVQTGPEEYRFIYRYDFDYSGRRRSRGWTKVTITVSLVGGGWLITSFGEKVSRY